MKYHRLSLLALLFACGTACQQKEILPEETTLPASDKKVVITASFANANTKISYTENSETHKLHQEWEEGDVLFGFDDNYNPLTMTVTAVDSETGIATLEPQDCTLPSSGAIHMVYTADRQRNNDNGSLLFKDDLPHAVDISFQTAAAGTTVPAVLTADATVSNAEVHLVFENQTAILGIKGFHGLPANSVVESFFVNGVNNFATISLVDGKLSLTSAENPSFPNSVFVEKSEGWTADETGAVDETFYVAVFPNTQPSEIDLWAYDSSNNEYMISLGSKSIAAGKYYYMNNKELIVLPVAFVTTASTSNPYYSFDEALEAANSSQENCTIRLMKDCSPTNDVTFTNTQAEITLDLHGHALTLSGNGITMNTPGVNVTICDSESQKGEILKKGNAAILIDVVDGNLTVSGACLSSKVDWAILKVEGGEVSLQDAILTHDCGSTRTLVCESGSLTIDNTLVEQKNTGGNYLVHITKNTQQNRPVPTVTIGGKSCFIHAGKNLLIYADGNVSANSHCVTINDAYFWHNASSNTNFMVYAANTGVITLNTAHFNKTYQQYRCAIGSNQSIVKIYPSVSVNGKSFNYRTLKPSVPAYNNTREAYVSYSVGEGKRLYPAKFNITYTPSTNTWAFRNQANGYSTDYNENLISLFTWGYGDWSVVPDGTGFLTGMTEGQTLSPEQDWGSVMNAGPCRVPTKEEWDYLLNERKASTVNGVANARFLKCYYYQSYGLLVFPDEFSWPSNAGNPPNAEAINNPNDIYSTSITNAGVSYLTQAGCIFLQADGYRVGNTVNMNSHLGTGANASGNYWSSTARGTNNESYFLNFNQAALWTSSYAGSPNTGHAVRLFFE